MPIQPEPPPYYAPLLEGRKERIATPWLRYLEAQGQEVQSASRAQASSSLSTQTATIGATPVLVTNSAGLYRITYYLRISRAATVSSSATVSIGWTDGGVPITWSAPAVTGNLPTTFQTDSLLVRSDGAAPLTYAVTYASVGATTMAFNLDVVVEAVS